MGQKMKSITIRDVAEAAKVSIGTVSMVLNGSEKVSEFTRQHVQRTIDAMGYRRNPHARSLSQNKSYNIGFVVTDLTNPFFGSMVGLLQNEINERDNSLVLGMTQNQIPLEKRAIERLLRIDVDGLILVPAHTREADTAHIRELIQRGLPLVFISSHYAGLEQGCVMTDLSRGAYLLVRHLLDKGRRRIAFAGGYRGLTLTEKRIDGYRRAHADAGVQVDERMIIEAEPIFEGGQEAATKLLQGAVKPDAVVSVNDLVCMGVLSRLRERGMRVPEDVAVAGYDDLVFSSMLETPLTTVRQPLRAMCARAADMLFRQIAGEESNARPVLLEPELVVRAST
jgi:DNA-binding LacI/PurR family transcriptional regulator